MGATEHGAIRAPGRAGAQESNAAGSGGSQQGKPWQCCVGLCRGRDGFISVSAAADAT